MPPLEDVSLEELHKVLSEVEGSRATQRVMVAINYKHEDSVTQSELAERYDISEVTVNRWLGRVENIKSESVEEAVYDAPREGRPRKLPEEKFPELEEILREGPESFGFTGQRWTGGRVAQVIEQEFGVSVAERTAQRYLTELGWSHKKPKRVATERDPENIEEFRNKKWVEIRDTAKQDSKAIVFVDESKFRLLPEFLYTWAPKGEEATVESKSTFDFIAVIAAPSVLG